METTNRKYLIWTVFTVGLLTFLTQSMIWTLVKPKSGSGLPFPTNIDGVFYDNIGFQQYIGNGFSVDFQHPEWRQRYREASKGELNRGAYRWIFVQRGNGPTTMRSPGYPALLGTVYRLFGWRWDVARWCGCLLVSFGLALLVAWLARHYGWLPSVIAIVTLSCDYSIMRTGSTIASESLACFAFALLFLSASAACCRPSYGRWILTGLLLGAMMLIRGNWNLFYLILTGMFLLSVLPAVKRRLGPIQIGHLWVFWLACTILVTPWWIRNCVVTEHFQPFGTAGANGLVAAYCDESLEHYGNWRPDVYRRHQRAVRANWDESKWTLAQREYITGQESAKAALAWARANWGQVPRLMGYRVLSHWGLTNPGVPWFLQVANICLLIVGVAGCFLLQGTRRNVVLLILAIDTLVVMATWAHLGRYAIPIRPLIHLGYGLGAYQCLLWGVRWFRPAKLDSIG